MSNQIQPYSEILQRPLNTNKNALTAQPRIINNMGTHKNAKIKACDRDKSGVCLRQMSILAKEHNAEFGILRSSHRFVKRLFDIILSATLLLLLSPLFIVVITVLLLTGEHKVFYMQERIGKGGKPFRILKFATMIKNSATTGTKTITVRNDPRVLPVGRILRKTKINELPQLLNVFIGKMSIIGPRPLVAKGYGNYSDTVRQSISKLKPGLTGIGSIVFIDEEKYVSQAYDPALFYRSVIFPHKGELECWYCKHCSLHVDLAIVLVTVWIIFFPTSNLTCKIFKTMPKVNLEELLMRFNSNG